MRWSFRTSGNYVEFVHTDETDLHEELVVFRLHTSSNCIDWSFPVDTTRVTFTIDETRYENILATDIDFNGVALTDAADFATEIINVFTGLSSGGGGLQSATIEVTHTQIVNLTQVEILPAPGAGKAYMVNWAILFINGTDIDYANFNNNSLAGIRYDTGLYPACQLLRESGSASLSNFFAFGEPNFASLTTQSLVPVAATPSSPNTQPDIGDHPLAAIENQALVWHIYNEPGTLTNGDAGNVLKVTVYYVIYDV